MRVGALELLWMVAVAALRGAARGLGAAAPALIAAQSWLRSLSAHTGVPALLVAAIALAIGYRVLRRSARFVAQVVVVAFALAAASELGWLRW